MFWNHGCKVIDIEQGPEDRFQLSGRGDELFVEGLGAIASALGDGNLDQYRIETASLCIKVPFVGKHYSEVPKDELGSKRDPGSAMYFAM